jgi:hypothetical protein
MAPPGRRNVLHLICRPNLCQHVVPPDKEAAMTVLKVPFPLWVREHGGGVSMAVMQLVDNAFDVIHHRGVNATQIPNGRFPTLEAAQARADEYMKEQGHECGAACGAWHRKI